MKNWVKIAIILGLSFLAMITEAGAGFTILVLLIYFEFIRIKEKR